MRFMIKINGKRMLERIRSFMQLIDEKLEKMYLNYSYKYNLEKMFFHFVAYVFILLSFILMDLRMVAECEYINDPCPKEICSKEIKESPSKNPSGRILVNNDE